MTNAGFLTKKARLVFTLVILASLAGLFLMSLVQYSYAQGQSTVTFGSDLVGSAAQGGGTTGVNSAPNPAAQAQCSTPATANGGPCRTWSFFGMYFATGVCEAGQCVAMAVTPLGGIGVGVLTTALNIGINRAINGAPGSNSPTYYPTNPNQPAGCNRAPYVVTTPRPANPDPCAIYMSTVPSGTTNVNLGGGAGGSTTNVVTSGPATATLSATPTSGTAPLSVTFIVTDTSTACSHPAIMISAGDGTDAVVALPSTTSCTGRTPRTFTGTYRTAGTYKPTIISAGTQQILQTVTITVSGSGSTTATSSATAFLTASPTSGPAPLSVTFTVADTSTSCAHRAVMLSAGDGTDPVVAIPETTSCTNRTPRSFTGVYRTAGTYRATITSAGSERVLQTVTITVGGGTATTTTETADGTNARLDVEPTSGTAPLSVRLTVTDTSTTCARSGVSLSVTSGTAPTPALPAASACGNISPRSFNYTYQTAGTFRTEILNSRTNRPLQSVSITVRNGNSSTSPLSVTNPTGSGTVDVSSSRLNLSKGAAGTAAPTRSTAAQPRTWGDITASASGVTITAGGHEADGRTGIAGFYGYNTIPGLQPQELKQKMCNERPWLSSGASPIIPPSFFDSICTARGFKAGASARVSTSGTGAGAKASPSSSSITPKTATTTSKGAGPIEVLGPAKVYITAVPASVKIGTRTSIFWNAVGVKACVVRSPDGSFTGRSLSGAASTVPITGETIYSIVCLKPDGSQVSSFVKVKIAN